MAIEQTSTAQRIATKLSDWFNKHHRKLPWRQRYLPYEILISEMMLQQTQITTMLPYYEKWMNRFPTLVELANCDVQEVMHSWQGLGYYARARNLHQCAKLIVSLHQGQIPSHYENLIQLPGIGPYSAGAIASIAFNQKKPAIDGNVKRVLARIYTHHEAINLKSSQVFFTDKILELLSHAEPRVLNQALMELGSQICTPKKPDCEHCPLENECGAHLENLVSELPKVEKNKRHQSTVIFLLNLKNNQIALTYIPAFSQRNGNQQQKQNAWWKGLHSLPFFQLPSQLDLAETLKELKSPLTIDSIELIDEGQFGISNHQVKYFLLAVNESQIQKLDISNLQYYSTEELKSLSMSANTKKLIQTSQNYV